MSLLADQKPTAAAAPEAAKAPRHVAIIMDGNGRWATARGLPRGEGHRRGVEAVRQTVRAAIDLGIRYLTLYSFSSENWSRPRDEVDFLFGLFRLYIRRDVADLHAQGVRISVIGNREGLPGDILELIENAEALTAGNRRLHLIFAFNYGARNELVRADARHRRRRSRRARSIRRRSTRRPSPTTSTRPAYPDPDLVIRTGGEIRLSNFLLWQSAYAELVFLQVNWPDFGRDAMVAALETFAARSRRYGGRDARESA